MLLLSAIAVVVVVGLLARVVSAPTMGLLYSGLDSASASGVIEGLERQGVVYEVRGDAIYVPTDQRDRVRITLAGEGLPAAGAAGYELLDGLSGFGTTAEMFDAAYWRAKEGELARTILASHRVIRARVHIAQTKRRPFERETPVTASVTVSTSSGALSRQQAEAIRYLVASAVAGLSLHNVAIIDQENGVVLRSGESDGDAAVGDEANAQAAALRSSVERLLEARVGPGAAVVEVSVEAARDSETIRQRTVDPDSQIIIHKDTEESTDAAQGDAAGVTVASNLADGDVESAGEGGNRQASRTRERVNYEVSETLRETVRPPGEVKRITVAVMIDGVRGPNSWEPRPPEELAALKELVQSAVGYDAERGDVVTIQSLEFTEIGGRGALAERGAFDLFAANAMSLIQIAALSLVALLLGLFVIRPILTRDAPPPLPALEAPNANAGFGGEPAQIGNDAIGGGFEALPSMDDNASSMDFGMGAPMGGLDGFGASQAEDTRISEVQNTVAERPEDAIRVLRDWLDAPDPQAKAEAVP